MPLIEGYTPKIIKENIATLQAEGKDEKQAVAIAYSKARAFVEFKLALAKLRGRRKKVRELTLQLTALKKKG